MRDIKFRLWSNKLNKMFEPGKHKLDKWYFDCEYNCVHFPMEVEDPSLGVAIEKDSVLLQYTGLKDKNGTEIYEGDIVQHEDFSNGAFFSNQPVKRTVMEWNNYYHGYKIKGLGYFKSEHLEVIGNIYEHLELLND